MQTRLRGQYNGKWPISLVCVSRPLVTVITAIAWDIRKDLHADRGVGGNNVDITHTERVYNSRHSPVNQMRSYRKHLKWEQQNVFIEITSGLYQKKR